MNKQQDLINVFNFLAEYLRDETKVNVNPVNVNPVGVDPVSVDELEVKATEQPDYKVLGVPSRDILELMKKIEVIDKQKAEINSIVNEQDKSFTKELKRIREEHAEIVKKFEMKIDNVEPNVPKQDEAPTSSGSTTEKL
jgi:hypothetical protein